SLAAVRSARVRPTTAALAPCSWMAGTSAASVVATVSSPEVAPRTQAPANRSPREARRTPARVPASASLTRRSDAWAEVSSRSRPRAWSRCAEGRSAPSVWAAPGTGPAVGAGSAATADGAAARARAPRAARAARAAVLACLWAMRWVSFVRWRAAASGRRPVVTSAPVPRRPARTQSLPAAPGGMSPGAPFRALVNPPGAMCSTGAPGGPVPAPSDGLEAGRSGLRDEGGRGGDGGAGGRHGGDGAEVGAGAVPSQFEPQVAAPPVVVPQVRVGLHVGVPVGRPLHAVPPAGHGGAGELGAQGGGVGVVEVVLD